MKTSDVSSSRPVQQNTQQPKADGKKSKDFKEVLDHSGGKQVTAGKKKAFSPLNQSDAKGEKMQARNTRGHERVEGREEREGVDEKGLGSGKKKSSLGSEEVQLQPNQMMGGLGGAHSAAKMEKAEATRGLSMEELQSIVSKVHLGVTEKGLPEMRFEIQTHNLGPMSLNISADGDKIKIDFVTEDINAQDVLKDNLNELSNMLQQKGLKLDQTNFSTRDQEKNEQQQQQSEQAWEGPMLSDPAGRPKRGFSL